MREELQRKLALNSLKNIIKCNMASFSLIGIYDSSSIEIAYYKEKMEEFLQLWYKSKLNAAKIPTGYDDTYYYDWILSEIPDINHNDEWLITRDGCYAKIRAADKHAAIQDLFHMDKPESKRLGYCIGFLAVNITCGLIVDVGVYSDSENDLSLSIQKI